MRRIIGRVLGVPSRHWSEGFPEAAALGAGERENCHRSVQRR